MTDRTPPADLDLTVDFSGRTALITGAHGGIGQSLCRLFAGHGAAVAGLDRKADVAGFAAELAREFPDCRAIGLVADIADGEAVAGAVARAGETLGPIDILVNNAGFSPASSLATTGSDDWVAAIDGNLNGTYHCTSAVLETMTARDQDDGGRGGTIVNIGSVNGLISVGDPAYSAAKAGMISYTKAVAMEYGRYGIRCNIVCPGTVRTPIWDHRVARNPDILDQLSRWYPLGRVARPIEIAKAVAFLASDHAAAITGAVLTVDCGLTAGNPVMTREVTLEDV